MLLTTTSALIKVTTSSTADIDVCASWADQTTTAFTPWNTNRLITTATTTNVVDSPWASTQRQVKSLIIRNDHASSQNTITVSHTDGTTQVNVFSCTLAAWEQVVYRDDVGWIRFNSAGIPLSGSNTWASDVQTFTTSGANTWTKPTTFTPKVVIVELVGGGWGGGAWASLATAVVAKGGWGWGGGAWRRGIFAASDLSSTETVTIGAGGVAGARGAAGAAGWAWGVWWASTFGSYLTAYGWGGWAGWAISAAVTGGGGGGGTWGAWGNGSTSGWTGWIPTAASNGAGGQWVTWTVAVSTTGNAEFGGGAWAWSANPPVANSSGGSSLCGGGGGGSGWGHTATPAIVAGWAGGRSWAYASGGGGGVGTDGATPTAWTNWTDATSTRGGYGGGGGGTTITASTGWGNWGNGGIGGGGGGWGGVGMNPWLGGNGGTGGVGYCIVYTY